jgi:hypothetical protein
MADKPATEGTSLAGARWAAGEVPSDNVRAVFQLLAEGRATLQELVERGLIPRGWDSRPGLDWIFYSTIKVEGLNEQLRPSSKEEQDALRELIRVLDKITGREAITSERTEQAQRDAIPDSESVVATAPVGDLGGAEEPAPPAIVTYIRPMAYLRSVWAIIWGALRHPFSTTLVDLSTGEAVHLPAQN